VTLVAGFAPDGRGVASLHLASMMARSSGDDLVVCAVIPLPWPPGPARVDAEYRAHLEQTAQEALTEARARLDADVPGEALVHHARSAPAGLIEVAERRDAEVIVVGSSSEGAIGRVALGSVSGRLLHSSPIPIALAPRGFRARPGARVRRITAAFGGSGGDDLVIAAAGVAARVGATLRLASFAVRARPPVTAGVGRVGDEAMVADWVAEMQAAAKAALERVRDALPVPPEECEAVVGRGERWEEAIEDVEWADGDVLVVGSSSVGPIARVFIGSRASKIVRHAPVPVVVVPRGAAEELADEAVRGEPQA
jgi:nucleotide-binding universal stress UspA family protein